jgi:hypothetical protein
MRLPRVRFTVRAIMAAVAVAALTSLAAKIYREYPSTEKRVVILVASVVAGAYGLGAMRRPLVFLVPLLVVWVATPAVDHPSFSIFNISVGGCVVGWIIGAPAGWISRCLKRAGNSYPVASEPPKPE